LEATTTLCWKNANTPQRRRMIQNEIKIKNKETGYQSGGFVLPGFLDTMEDGTKLHLMNANIQTFNFNFYFQCYMTPYLLVHVLCYKNGDYG
jgi:hypothetical protein